MISPAPDSITALPKGHEFPAAHFTLARQDVAAYLRAVGDGTDYGAHAPPLAAVALALRALQERIALPNGSLHTGQDVEHLALVPLDAALTLASRIAQRSERQGFVIAVLEYEIAAGGTPLVRARSTIMAPGDRP